MKTLRAWRSRVRTWHDGMRELVFEPLELLERLAAMTPRPETNLLICHGVLAYPTQDAGWDRAASLFHARSLRLGYFC